MFPGGWLQVVAYWMAGEETMCSAECEPDEPRSGLMKDAVDGGGVVDCSSSGDGGPLSSILHQPDGGWGWVVCLTSMFCNGTVFGSINTFGILYVAMKEKFGGRDSAIAFKTCEFVSIPFHWSDLSE